MEIIMLSTVYTHGFNRHEVNDLLLKMANLQDAIAKDRGGEIERAKLHYAIERFCAKDHMQPDMKNIAELHPIYEVMASILKPTHDYWEKQKDGEK